jgi:hypothetical protein
MFESKKLNPTTVRFSFYSIDRLLTMHARLREAQSTLSQNLGG